MQQKTLELKSDGEGRFSGWASRYDEVDSYGDAVIRGAYDDTVRENGGQIVILSDHDPNKTIGLARMTLKAEGLWIDATLSLELQDARDAYVRLRDRLKSGLSIGYETLRQRTKGGVRELLAIKLFEVSVVTFPALPSARVLAVKSNDEGEALLAGLRSLKHRIAADVISEGLNRYLATMRRINASLRASK